MTRKQKRNAAVACRRLYRRGYEIAKKIYSLQDKIEKIEARIGKPVPEGSKDSHIHVKDRAYLDLYRTRELKEKLHAELTTIGKSIDEYPEEIRDAINNKSKKLIRMSKEIEKLETKLETKKVSYLPYLVQVVNEKELGERIAALRLKQIRTAGKYNFITGIRAKLSLLKVRRKAILSSKIPAYEKLIEKYTNETANPRQQAHYEKLLSKVKKLQDKEKKGTVTGYRKLTHRVAEKIVNWATRKARKATVR